MPQARRGFQAAQSEERAQFEAVCLDESELDEESYAVEDASAVGDAMDEFVARDKSDAGGLRAMESCGGEETALQLAVQLEEETQELFARGSARRLDAVLGDGDAARETLAGKGPFGAVGLLLGRCLGCARLLRSVDENDGPLDAFQAPLDAKAALLRLREVDERFSRRFKRELETCARFHLLVLSAADAHLVHEKAHFKAFARERRLQLGRGN